MHLVPRSLNIILQYKPGVHEEITDFRAETWQVKINVEYMSVSESEEVLKNEETCKKGIESAWKNLIGQIWAIWASK